MQGKTCLVTGGAGFLGSHLCEKLLDLGAEAVICVDNLMTGSKRNIQDCLEDPRFQFVEHDVETPFQAGFELDYIFHLACPASPPWYQKDPVRTSRICFQGTLNFLELAKQAGAVFFYASTSEVYGDPLEHPQKESYRGWVNTLGPRACYDEGKRIGETLCFDYYRQGSVQVKVGRIFNTYGPRMDPEDGRVVSNFICQALAEEPLTIYGQGHQTRSFCYVDDLIKGILALTLSEKEVTGPINLGNPKEFTVRELGEKVLSRLGLDVANIIFRPLPEDDPQQRKPDISLASRLLGWSPKVHLDEGLERTILYFKGIISQAHQ